LTEGPGPSAHEALRRARLVAPNDPDLLAEARHCGLAHEDR